MKIAFDMDGVLADFCWAFTGVLKDLDPAVEQVHPDKVYAYDFGLDKELIDEAWEVVKRAYNWWEGLPCLLTPRERHIFNQIAREEEAYVVTSRIPTRGMPLVAQVKNWLWINELEDNVEVIVTNALDKGKACLVEGIEVLIDDQSKVIEAAAPYCNVIVRDWPYNRDLKGVTRITSLEELPRVLGVGF